MANIGHKEKYYQVKSKILRSAAKLFLEKGYKNTTMNELAKVSNISYGALFRTFEDKEAVLCELVGYVLEAQFEMSEKLLKDNEDKILFYAFETTLQLYLAESSEHMREMYNVSYSLFNSSQKVYNTITNKLEYIFKEHLPNLETKDFYELEIASAGIMRNFMSVPCNIYFTMDRKINRFLETTFLIYRVDDKKINEAIEFVSKFNFKKIANELLNSLLTYLEDKV